MAQSSLANKIHVTAELKKELKVLVDTGVLLQKFYVSKNKDDVTEKKYLLNISKSLDLASRLVTQEDHSDQVALKPTFETLRVYIDQLDQSSSSYKDRSLARKKIFNQLVHIARLVKFHHVGIYFCSSDKAFWVQSNKSLPKNPVSPKYYKNCAKRVNLS